jgi:hypothetical protein
MSFSAGGQRRSIRGDFARSSAFARPPKKDTSGWSAFLRHLVDRGLKGGALIISDACRALVESVAEYLPEAS